MDKPVSVNDSRTAGSDGVASATSNVDHLRIRAEELWEELGGDLCICQNPDVPHWCERCQGRIDVILAAFSEVVTSGLTPADANAVVEKIAERLLEPTKRIVQEIYEQRDELLVALKAYRRHDLSVDLEALADAAIASVEAR